MLVLAAQPVWKVDLLVVQVGDGSACGATCRWWNIFFSFEKEMMKQLADFLTREKLASTKRGKQKNKERKSVRKSHVHSKK
jgi:hypothetical protein